MIGDWQDRGLIPLGDNEQSESARLVAFAEQTPSIRTLIAGNAELLIELYQENSTQALDQMRAAGRRLLEQPQLVPDSELDGVDPKLWETMGRRHHERWLEQFQRALDDGRRTDRGHRGNRPFDELPPIEGLILKVQAWANWRVLASLIDADYQIIRSGAPGA